MEFRCRYGGQENLVAIYGIGRVPVEYESNICMRCNRAVTRYISAATRKIRLIETRILI